VFKLARRPGFSLLEHSVFQSVFTVISGLTCSCIEFYQYVCLTTFSQEKLGNSKIFAAINSYVQNPFQNIV